MEIVNLAISTPNQRFGNKFFKKLDYNHYNYLNRARVVSVLKKGDFIIIAVVVMVFIVSAFAFLSFDEASRVIIKQDNKIVYDQSIDQNTTFDTGTNLVVINGNTYKAVKDKLLPLYFFGNSFFTSLIPTI